MNDTTTAASAAAAPPVAAPTASITMSPQVFEDKARNAAQLILSAAEMSMEPGSLSKDMAVLLLQRALDNAISQFKVHIICSGVTNAVR